MKDELARKILEKTQRDYDLIASHFSQTRIYAWPEMEYFKKYVRDGMKVLDLACGNGRLLQVLKDFEIEYLGVDFSAKQLAAAQAKYGLHHTKLKAAFQVGQMQEIPAAADSFDLVFLVASFYHLPSHKLRLQALTEIQRVLRPGGYLLMTNWNLWQPIFWGLHFKFLLKKIIGHNQMDFGDLLMPWKNPQGERLTDRYMHAFSPSELKLLFEHNHFQVTEAFYSRQDKKTSFLKGFNSVIVGRLEK